MTTIWLTVLGGPLDGRELPIESGAKELYIPLVLPTGIEQYVLEVRDNHLVPKDSRL